VSSLLDIEKNGITVPLIDEKEFSQFVSDNSGAVFIGNEKDWIAALKSPCEHTGSEMTVYNQFAAMYDPAPKLEYARYCFSGSTDTNNEEVSELISYLKGNSFPDTQLHPGNLKSNMPENPTKPHSSLERLIASQIFFGMAVERYVLAIPYKNQILVLYAASQEPGIPGYRTARIYLKNEKLYVKDEYINPKSSDQFGDILDKKYGKNFSATMIQDSYSIESNIENPLRTEFDPEEIRLYTGSWSHNPSIINKKIEERLITDLKALK